MPNVKPYMTTDSIIESIKRRISMPLSQVTFTYNDITAFINEELQINAVPSIKEAHEEYFVYKAPPVPLVNGISIYGIPDRAIGMALRDLAWSDVSGNYFKMTRIAPEDKAYFQQNVGSNQAIGKYYLEGNNIVITPQISSGATGFLNFSIFLRPNYLVRNDRAAIIQSYQKPIVIGDINQIVDGDTITIITGNQTPSPVVSTFVATSSTPTSNYQFQIGIDANSTASNLTNTINNVGMEDVTASNTNNVCTVSYIDLSSTFANTASGVIIDNNNVFIQFDNLPSTYTDPETDETSALYATNSKVDFLQTDGGHRTYTYSIRLRQILPGNVGRFKATDLQTYLNNSSGGTLQFWQIQIGDYICLENECIIPQIPSELHTALAERVGGRVLMAIGDKDGAASSAAKVAEMDKQQATLIGSRVEGSVTKVFNSSNLLRLGKRSSRRRI